MDYQYFTIICMGSDKKIPLEEVKKISPKILLLMISRAKRYLKTDPTMQEICKKYDTDINIIDYIPIMFGHIDTSAKTDHGTIILNYKLLCDGDFYKDFGYLVHEGTHWLQQLFRNKPTKSSNEGNYLDNLFEVEAFKFQSKYIADHFGDQEAEGYIEGLLDHHDIKGKKRKNKEEELLAKV